MSGDQPTIFGSVAAAQTRYGSSISMLERDLRRWRGLFTQQPLTVQYPLRRHEAQRVADFRTQVDAQLGIGSRRGKAADGVGGVEVCLVLLCLGQQLFPCQRL